MPPASSRRRALARGGAVLILALGAAACATETGRTDAEVRRLVRAELAENPAIVRDALKKLVQRQKDREAATTAGRIERLRPMLLDGHPAMGPAEAQHTLVQFYDYRCEHCRRASPAVQRLVTERATRVIYIPVAYVGPGSRRAARLALAAARQDAFGPMHKALMAHEGAYSRDALMKLAVATGLDRAALERTMADDALPQTLRRNERLARAIGLKATPMFVTGRRAHTGALPFAGLVRFLEGRSDRVDG